MFPPATAVEQQAKLGVSAEDSKAHRLKRLQARFRDRGGAFVPSNSNPLVDILLARTVSGESPSKARPKDATTKQLSSSKAHRVSPMRRAGAANVTEESQAVAGSSRPKLPPRKREAKAIEPQADTGAKPAPKRRGRPPKDKKKVPALDSNTEQSPANSKSKSASKGKGKQCITVLSTSNGNLKTQTKPKPQVQVKSKPTKEVVEVLVSDDDQTLVDVPHKAKANPKKNARYEDYSEIDDDALNVRKRAIPRVGDSKASGSKTTTRHEVEKFASTEKHEKKTLEDGERRLQGGRYSKTNAKKRPVRRGDDDDDVLALPVKKGKVATSATAKSKNATEPKAVPRRTKDINSPTVAGKGKGKMRGEDIIEPAKEDDVDGPPEGVSNTKKRKKEDSYDDRPRKVVKFSETGPSHSSSQNLKENQAGRRCKSAAKSSVEDEPDGPHQKLVKGPPARTSKGPPREVLERIKASAVQHLRCADSEPDELDCLS